MADDADGGGLWRINPDGSISLLISSRRHSGFTIRNTAFLQSGVPFVRLTLVALNRRASRIASPWLPTGKAARRSLEARVRQGPGHKPPQRATRAASGSGLPIQDRRVSEHDYESIPTGSAALSGMK